MKFTKEEKSYKEKQHAKSNICKVILIILLIIILIIPMIMAGGAI